MRVFSYVVRHDSGFAPNPFHGFCTLACCKPRLRNQAKVGDFVVGLTSRSEHAVYVMRVSEVLTFAEYWSDERFVVKRPTFQAGAAAAQCGDNIYQPVGAGEFRQLPSFHSSDDGRPNEANLEHDLGSLHVLVASDFVYFGGGGPALPSDLGFLRVARNHRSRFTAAQVSAVEEWFGRMPRGVVGPPGLWIEDDGSWRAAGGCSRSAGQDAP